MSSTRKTLQHISSAKKSPGVVDVAAADVAADAVGEAAAAVAAAAAACPGDMDIAASARSKPLATRVTDKGQYGRVLLDPASPVLFAVPAVILAAQS
jgi:hypothetical protein